MGNRLEQRLTNSSPHIGRVGDGIMTVRFTYRGHVIRIYGAGYWRRGRKVYEEKNKIY